MRVRKVLFVVMLAAVPPALALAALARTSPSTTSRATAPAKTVSLAERLALARPWLKRAAREAAAVDDPQQRLMAMGDLAGVWARAGQVAPFEKTIADMEADEAKQGAGRNISPTYRYSGTAELICMLVQANRKDEARKLVQKLRDSEQWYPAALETLGRALALAGDDAAANAVADGAPEKLAAGIRYTVAIGQASRRDEKAAMATAKQLGKRAVLSGILFALVRADCDAGDFSAALQVAARVPQKGRSTAYGIVVDAQLKQGKFAAARKTIELVSDAARRDRAFLDLTFRQTMAGDLDGARATLKQMNGQSQELPGVILLRRELIKRGDEAAARNLVAEIKDPKLRQRALGTLPQILVMTSADGGDPRRALAHLQEMPAKDRNFTLCLCVATAMLKAKNMDGYHKMLAAARAQVDAQEIENNRVTWYRELTYQAASGGDAEGASKIARRLENPAERISALAGALNGCAQAGDLAAAWGLVAEMGPGQERRGAVNVAARYSVIKHKTADLTKQVDALPPGERMRACIAIAAAYLEPAPPN